MAVEYTGRPRAIFAAAIVIGFLLFGIMESGYVYGALAVTGKGTSQTDLMSRMNKPAAGKPVMEVRVHKVGNIWLTVTNYGIFGNQADPSIKDPETNQPAPSCQYPGPSGVEYLFQGALWIGAIVGEDTLVSTGHDGWQHIFEMYADQAPKGSIIKRSTRLTDPAYSPDAVSEADYMAVYTDTLTDQQFVAINPDDNRSHIPIGVEITQKSYSWSYSYAEDFILIDFLIKNIGTKEIRKSYIGLYVDADVYHPSYANGFQDDICGFKQTVPSTACKDLQDVINVAWIADQDGDPNEDGVFDYRSTVAVTGTRVVRTPNPDLKTSFNWWVSQGDATLDWGPVRKENNRNLGTGGLGTPAGDKNKYFFLKNGEFDYDQIYSAIDMGSQGWLPPASNIASDLADGYDTRYLLSFGPFDIQVGDSLPLTIGYIAGDKFHVKPDDFQKYFDSNNPDVFFNKLSFSDLATNALWAGWVYDNPGVSTNGSGFRGNPTPNPCSPGDTIWSGDGLPDFDGPPPPPPPVLKYSSSPGQITVRWNGYATETSKDPFSSNVDFEGYRVYMGQRLSVKDFALLTSYDHLDFDRHKLNLAYAPPKWELTEVPFTLDSLAKIYGEGFNPLDYPNQSDSLTWIDGTDTNYYYFTQQDYNRSTLGGFGEMRKVYPDATPADTVWDEMEQDSVPAYYEYEYSIDGMLPSRPVFISVSAFDFGDPATNLGPLESSPLANAVQIYPVNSPDVVTQQNLKVTVFPNPYKINGGYAEAGYEDVGASLSPDRARRIYFANLPSKATIRIYTLDGDLVRELEHPQPVGSVLYAGESMTAWDLISRNTQAAVSGIYLYTVESELGTQVGKFVIIK